MKKTKLAVLSLIMLVLCPVRAFANEDLRVIQSSVPQGTTGSNITVSFNLVTDEYWDCSDDLYMIISPENNYDFIDEATPSVYGYAPFEFTTEQEKYQDGYIQKIGKVSKSSQRSVSFSLKVRRDVPEGYYEFKVIINRGNPKEVVNHIQEGDLKIWVRKGTQTVNPDNKNSSIISFELGEGQATPYAAYPALCNFALNLRNSGSVSAYDVTAAMVCEADSTKFPFDINEANYNRHFDYVNPGETVSLPYSFAIRSETYTGYYPITMNITYREGSNGELKEEKEIFFVHVKNREKEDQKQQHEFNPNDRVKARIIVDSYHTEPEEVYAGNEYNLVVTFRNASANVDASNLLLTFESEKVQEAPVFTAAGGSNSVVIDSLKSGDSKTVTMHFSSSATVDQRPYSISISEKYDSPEFKNAEEKVSITVPVLQVAKFNMGNVEVLPAGISVGEEANVMFALNNTGKIMLYNVMVRFEDDSIVKNESYIGNLKPGATGNVDAMLTGAAATADDGHVDVFITYEDEFGEVTEVKKDIVLYVSEPFDFDTEGMDIDIPVEEEKPKKNWLKWLLIGGGAAGAGAAGIVVAKKKKRNK